MERGVQSSVRKLDEKSLAVLHSWQILHFSGAVKVR